MAYAKWLEDAEPEGKTFGLEHLRTNRVAVRQAGRILATSLKSYLGFRLVNLAHRSPEHKAQRIHVVIETIPEGSLCKYCMT